MLAKVTSYVPTTYAALLARDAYMQAVKIVDDMTATLRAIDRREHNEAEILPPDKPLGDKQGSGLASGPSDPFGGPNGSAPQPPKRGRGRPRKYPPANSLVTGASGQAD